MLYCNYPDAKGTRKLLIQGQILSTRPQQVELALQTSLRSLFFGVEDCGIRPVGGSRERRSDGHGPGGYSAR